MSHHPLRLWYLPDGAVTIQEFVVVEAKDRDTATYLEEHPGAFWEDVTREEFEAMRPRHPDGTPDNSQWHKWRKNPHGRGFVVDASVPDPPHPKQALLDAIAGATSMDEVKALLARVVRGE